MKTKKSFSSQHNVFVTEIMFSEHWNIFVKCSVPVLIEKKYCLCGFFMKPYESMSVTILLYMSKS